MLYYRSFNLLDNIGEKVQRLKYNIKVKINPTASFQAVMDSIIK